MAGRLAEAGWTAWLDWLHRFLAAAESAALREGWNKLHYYCGGLDLVGWLAAAESCAQRRMESIYYYYGRLDLVG